MNTRLNVGIEDLEDLDTPEDDAVFHFALGVAAGVTVVALFVAAT